jgi:uncharacterized protein YdgA (DUF945 family)
MKKGLAAAAVLSAGAMVALPWVLGAQSRQVYDTALARLQEQGVRVLDSRYSRGWLGSDASVLLELPHGAGQVQGTGSIPLRMESRIAHGPWSLGSPRLMPSAALIQSRLELEIPGLDFPPLLSSTRVELDGSGVTRVRLPAVTSKETGARLQIPEGEGELSFAPGFAAMEGRLVLPSLTMSGSRGERIELRGLRVEASGSRWIQGLHTGEGTLSLDQVKLQAPETSLRAAGIEARGKSIPDGDLLAVELQYGFRDLDLNGAAYGPSAVSFALRRLPGDALASLQRALRELAPTAVDESLYAVATATTFARHLPLLLSADPELALDPVEITTPEGAVTGRISLASRGATRQDLQRRGGWLEHLVGEGELNLPRPLLLRLLAGWERRETLDLLQRQGEPVAPDDALEARIAAQAGERLALLVRQGWLEESGEDLRAVARLADTLLTVNGKTIPVGAPAEP